MPSLPLGISIATLGLPLKKALPLLAEWGIANVELDARTEFKPSEFGESAIRQLRKMLDDHRLSVGTISYQTRRGYNVQEDLDARLAGTRAAMKFAASLGCRFVTNHIGLVPDEEDSAEWKLMTEVLAELGSFGQHVGAILCAKTGMQPAGSLSRLLAALPTGSLGIDFSPGQLLVHGHDPLATIEALGESILHVHANDATPGFGMSRGTLVPLGRGKADWPAMLGALQERDYRGSFTLEAIGTEDRDEELLRSVKYLRSL
jgi:sugar phosphate isomerase/epimerase